MNHTAGKFYSNCAYVAFARTPFAIIIINNNNNNNNITSTK